MADEPQSVYAEASEEELRELVAERELDVPEDADHEELVAALEADDGETHEPADSDGEQPGQEEESEASEEEPSDVTDLDAEVELEELPGDVLQKPLMHQGKVHERGEPIPGDLDELQRKRLQKLGVIK